LFKFLIEIERMTLLLVVTFVSLHDLRRLVEITWCSTRVFIKSYFIQNAIRKSNASRLIPIEK